MIKPLVLCLLLAVSPGASWAQTVWRCGPDGRSYSDSPCPGGRAVAVDDTRSAADMADARAVAARDQRLAQQLVAERHEREREAAARGSGLSAVTSAPVTAEQIKPRAKGWLPPARPKAKPRSPAGAETSRSAARASRKSRG